MEVDLTCICCPNSCSLKVDKEKKSVTGNKCPRGEKYGLSEVTHPVRVLTSTVKVINGEAVLVPVKSSEPIPKDLMFRYMDEINKMEISAPVTIGEVVISNVLNSGCDIIATKSVK